MADEQVTAVPPLPALEEIEARIAVPPGADPEWRYAATMALRLVARLRQAETRLESETRQRISEGTENLNTIAELLSKAEAAEAEMQRLRELWQRRDFVGLDRVLGTARGGDDVSAKGVRDPERGKVGFAVTDVQVAFLAFTLKYGLFSGAEPAADARGAKAGREMRQEWDAFVRGWKGAGR